MNSEPTKTETKQAAPVLIAVTCYHPETEKGVTVLSRMLALVHPGGGRASVYWRTPIRTLRDVEDLMREFAALRIPLVHVSGLRSACALATLREFPLADNWTGERFLDALPPWEPTEAHLRNRPLGYGFYLPDEEGQTQAVA